MRCYSSISKKKGVGIFIVCYEFTNVAIRFDQVGSARFSEQNKIRSTFVIRRQSQFNTVSGGRPTQIFSMTSRDDFLNIICVKISIQIFGKKLLCHFRRI